MSSKTRQNKKNQKPSVSDNEFEETINQNDNPTPKSKSKKKNNNAEEDLMNQMIVNQDRALDRVVIDKRNKLMNDNYEHVEVIYYN